MSGPLDIIGACVVSLGSFHTDRFGGCTVLRCLFLLGWARLVGLNSTFLVFFSSFGRDSCGVRYLFFVSLLYFCCASFVHNCTLYVVYFFAFV